MSLDVSRVCYGKVGILRRLCCVLLGYGRVCLLFCFIGAFRWCVGDVLMYDCRGTW